MFALPVPPPAETPTNTDLSAALAHISKATIPHAQRNVLRATAIYACNPDFLTSLLHFHEPAELDFLASMCRRGLIAFRNRGGRPSTGNNTPGGSTDIDSPASLDYLAQQSPPVPTLNLDSYPELIAICTAFNVPPSSLIPNNFTTLTYHFSSSSRPTFFADQIKARFPTSLGPHCHVTGSSLHLVGAHIIPHSIAKASSAPTSTQSSFWMFLVLFLGQELRDELWECFSSGVINTSANGLCLEEAVHGHFDRGFLTFDPIGEYRYDHPADDGYGTGRGEMKIVFVWHYWERQLELLRTFLPHDHHEDRADVGLSRHSRALKSGDIFTVETTDAELYPLPAKGLLQLHGLLWRAIGAAGLLDDPHIAPARKLKQPASRKRQHLNQAQVETPAPSYPTPHTSQPPVTPVRDDPPSIYSDHGQVRGQGQSRSVSGSSTSSGSTASSIFDVPTSTRTLRGPTSTPPPPLHATVTDGKMKHEKTVLGKRKYSETILGCSTQEVVSGKDELPLIFADLDQNPETELRVDRAIQALSTLFPDLPNKEYDSSDPKYGPDALEFGELANDSDIESSGEGYGACEDIQTPGDQRFDDCMRALVAGLLSSAAG
ncbi:hypothetical protein BGX38DRAFT_1228458 [Terfezia claveryi]|nr:hypothetical protein BGX38DRAFT_1228458 [Terfezia claveryi]